MSQQKPFGPYVYQPFGSVSHALHAKYGRLWGVAGVGANTLGILTTITGLTKREAEAVRDALVSLEDEATR